jgi:exodeoxyribonuclease-3
VCLQEIKAAPDQIPALLLDLEDYWPYWHGGGGYSGVGLLVSRALAASLPVFSHPSFDFEHRVVAVDLADLTVASVYVPNGGKDFQAKLRFLEALDVYAASFEASQRALVLCGDMNVALEERDVHQKERRAAAIGQRPEERALFARVLSHGLVDVARSLDPDNAALFTWWPPWRQMRERNIGWRIDYICASASLAGRASSCPVLKEVGTSDHAPVLATFE